MPSTPSASATDSLIVLDGRDELHHVLASEADDEFPDEFVFCGIPEDEIEVAPVHEEEEEQDEEGEELVLRSCPSFMAYGKCYNSHCKMVHYKPSFNHWEDSTIAQKQNPWDWLTWCLHNHSVVPPSPPSPPYAPALLFPSPHHPLPPRPYFSPIYNPYTVHHNRNQYVHPSPQPQYAPKFAYPTQPYPFYGGHC